MSLLHLPALSGQEKDAVLREFGGACFFNRSVLPQSMVKSLLAVNQASRT
jgi:hypothetical protein